MTEKKWRVETDNGYFTVKARAWIVVDGRLELSSEYAHTVFHPYEWNRVFEMTSDESRLLHVTHRADGL